MPNLAQEKRISRLMIDEGVKVDHVNYGKRYGHAVVYAIDQSVFFINTLGKVFCAVGPKK